MSACVSAVLLIAGCQSVPSQVSEKNQRILELEGANRQLQQQIGSLETRAERQRAQISALQNVAAEDGGPIVIVSAIKLDAHSGGLAKGVRVYFCPVDQAGHPVKAAGAVRIELFDLEAETQIRIGRWDFTPQEALDRFVSGPLIYHFSFKLPYPGEPPTREQLLLKVRFTDLLSGRVLSAQRPITIRK